MNEATRHNAKTIFSGLVLTAGGFFAGLAIQRYSTRPAVQVERVNDTSAATPNNRTRIGRDDTEGTTSKAEIEHPKAATPAPPPQEVEPDAENDGSVFEFVPEVVEGDGVIATPFNEPEGYVSEIGITEDAAVQLEDGTWEGRRRAMVMAHMAGDLEFIAHVQRTDTWEVVAVPNAGPITSYTGGEEHGTLLIDLEDLPPGEYRIEAWTRRLPGTDAVDRRTLTFAVSDPATFYDATPGRLLPGLPRMYVEYEWMGGGHGLYPDGDRSVVWSLDHATSELARAGDGPVLIDDESVVLSDAFWPDNDTAAAIEKLKQVLTVAKQAAPGNPIGAWRVGQPYYALGNIEHRRDEVEADAIATAELVERADYVMVSLYHRGDPDLAGWLHRAEINMAFARRWGKPVCVALMPWYHDSHHFALEGPIPTEDWRAMLEWSREHADMVAVWHFPASQDKVFGDVHRAAVMEAAAKDPPVAVYTNRVGQFPRLDLPRRRVIYANQIWRPSEDNTQLPAWKRFQDLIAHDTGVPIVLDVEHLPLDIRRHTPEEVEASLAILLQLVDWAREVDPDVDIGFYGLAPIRDYWTPQVNGDDRTAAWQAANDRMRALVDAVGTLYPSLYTFYDDRQGWETYATANVAEARRIADGKPVVPFIWPRYHTSNADLALQTIPADYWAFQLNTLEQLGVDGVMIWDAPAYFANQGGEVWDQQTPGIDATVEDLEGGE